MILGKHFKVGIDVNVLCNNLVIMTHRKQFHLQNQNGNITYDNIQHVNECQQKIWQTEIC